MTVHQHLLPYLEQDNLYKASTTSSSPGVVAIYLSPQDYTQPANTQEVTNFCANILVFGRPAATTGPGTWTAPSLGASATNPADARASLARMPDGSSNTLMYTTGFGTCAGTNLRKFSMLPGNGRAAFFGRYPATTQAGSAAVTVGTSTTPPSPVYTFQLAPNLGDCDANGNDTSVHAQSFSNAGITILTGDGAARTLSAGVSVATWNAAVHPSDGGLLDSTWND